MIENLYLTKRGNFIKGKLTYIEKDKCGICGEPYLTSKQQPSKFCSYSCAFSGRKPPMLGKKHTEEFKKRMSIQRKGMFSGKRHPNYKGGVKKLNLPLYSTYAIQLMCFEEIKSFNTGDIDLVEVRCAYCNRWFVPSLNSVRRRLVAFNCDPGSTNYRGEARFYCSDGCKKACPIFHKQKWPEGFKKATSREVQPELRQTVLRRDNYTCQYGNCGKTIEDVELHCYHLEGINLNPIESADVDMCITFCKEHHKLVHKQKGCRYFELQCKGEIKHE